MLAIPHHWALQATLGKQSEYFFKPAVYLSVVHQKKGELGDAQHWLSEVLTVPHAPSTESSKGAMQATAEFDLKPAVAKAVQLWATALGHLAHNEVEQAVEMLQQVCMSANAA